MTPLRIPLIFTLLATPLQAQEVTHTWGSGSPEATSYEQSRLTLGQPRVQGAEASAWFDNASVHTMNGDDVTLDLGGFVVIFMFERDVGGAHGTDDRITAYPPDGYIARPESILVPENETGEIHFFRYLGG